LGVPKSKDIQRGVIWRRHLKPPVHWLGEIGDSVVTRTHVTLEPFPHRPQIDRWHPPIGGFNGAAVESFFNYLMS
jgi:hypothetical protein